MEAAGLVRVGNVGNAVARTFTASDAHETARAMYGEDDSAFLKQGERVTPLSFGHTIQNVKGAQCVIDPDKAYPSPRATQPHAD